MVTLSEEIAIRRQKAKEEEEAEIENIREELVSSQMKVKKLQPGERLVYFTGKTSELQQYSALTSRLHYEAKNLLKAVHDAVNLGKAVIVQKNLTKREDGINTFQYIICCI